MKMGQMLYTDENSLKNRWLGDKGKMRKGIPCCHCVKIAYNYTFTYIINMMMLLKAKKMNGIHG